MEIAVIGNGLTGKLIEAYLLQKGYKCECLGITDGQKVDGLSPEKGKLIEIISNQTIKSKSPKFQRSDVKAIIDQSDKILKKIRKGLFCIEAIGDFGLAQFWGANLAAKSLSNEIEKLGLEPQEQEFLESFMPIMDVQKHYALHRDLCEWNHTIPVISLDVDEEAVKLYPATLGVFKERCMPCSNCDISCKAIKGNKDDTEGAGTTINTIVNKLEYCENSKKVLVHFEAEKLERVKSYDRVYLAAGAIGSFRVVAMSIKMQEKAMFRLKHHPFLTSICLMRNHPAPRDPISMSNYDAKVDIDGEQCYMNFFPLFGVIKALARRFTVNAPIKYLAVKSLSLYRAIDKHVSQSPLWIGWWMRRIYFTNIYFSEKCSSTYIGIKENEIELIGGVRSDWEKSILHKYIPMLRTALSNCGINMTTRYVKKHQPGADLHYASSLSSFVKANGQLKGGKVSSLRSVYIIDASSSESLPTANPTYYFLARSLKLVSESLKEK